ncbi:putative F-box protein At1g65770 isoform X2 [Quercus robur]|uniref:putative F-box protein At1g65770 isoform X2 n=1 Tax=Quercus robur TaxID=38942 RepID=UPI002163118C|nr:putative F-box protein At1g65770 isoform X2 [Quercus robur]
MGEREVDWSALPMELLPLIGKTVQARIDVVRLRSVCASLRTSIPPLRGISPPLLLPSPFSINSAGGQSFLSQSSIYRLEPLDDNPNLSTCSSKGWLVKVEEYEPGRVRLLNPLSSLRIRFFPDSFPKVINLLDFRVVEVGKAYKLQKSSGMNIAGVNKLVLFPNSAWTSCVEDKLIFGLFHEGKLGYVKYGDENWTFVDDHNFFYDDITVYKGQPYVVDRLGIVSWIDSSMKLIQFSPPLCGLGNQKHLVESCGELYVVDRSFDRERRFDQDLRRYRLCPKTVNIEVYKLDQEWGCKVMVKNLGDQVFFLGKDSSFSVSATEFSGCKGNCVYFTDENDIGVFYFENQKIGRIVDFQDRCHLIWPPPSWLSSKSSSKC